MIIPHACLLPHTPHPAMKEAARLPSFTTAREPVQINAGKLPGNGLCMIFKAKWNHEGLFFPGKAMRFRVGHGKSGSYSSMIG